MNRESWFTRLRGSFFGVVIGLGLLVSSAPVLFLNEGRAVQTARSLEEGAAVVVHVPASPVQAIHEGKLVHFHGPAVTAGTLRDPELGIEVKALQLVRKAEMYQWVESRRSHASTDDPHSYEYATRWSEELRPSNGFHNSAGHANPPAFPFPTRTLAAADVSVGDFQVPQRVIASLRKQPSPLLMDERALAAAPRGGYRSASGEPGPGAPRLDLGGLYYGGDPQNPQVGDTRVRFAVVELGDLSVIGRQRGHSTEPFPTRVGRDLELAEVGLHSPEAMFDGAMRSNTFLTWMLRFVGFGEMALGITLIFRPTSLLTHLVPLAGSMIDAATALLAFGVASVGSLVIIAVAWLVYRPLLSVGLLVLGIGIGVAVTMARRRVRMVAVTPPPWPASPPPFTLPPPSFPPPPPPSPLPPVGRQPPPMPQ